MKNAVIASLCFLAVLTASILMVFNPETELCDVPEIRFGEIPGYTSESMPASESEINVLPGDTEIVKRMYSAGECRFVVTAVIGGKSKSSIHRPELCLPSQGFLMSKPKTVNISGIDWRQISLESGAASYGFSYTFFNQDGFYTSSHIERIFTDVWDRSIKNRIDRWVMVSVFTTELKELDGFLAKLAEDIK